MTSPVVAIVGGGISGLAAAYEFLRLRVPFVLVEQGGRCGGVVRTERTGGYTIDAGPDALLRQKPAAITLCQELGLGDRLCAQRARDTFIVRRGRLRRLPDGAVMGMPARWAPFALTGAFSLAGKLRMAMEPLRGRAPAAADESIASFIGRRFGQHAVDYLAEPLLAGIHGGDPATLSMRALFPRFLALEATHGSVVAGLRLAPAPPAGAPAPFVSLQGGMSELTDALAQRLPPGALHLGTAVSGIDAGRGEYTISLADGRRLTVPQVMVAVPPAAAARLLRPCDAPLADLCGRIRSTSMVTVALGYARTAVGHALAGSGVLVPRREGLGVRAISWMSSKWPERAPGGRVLLRAYIGGAADPGAVDRPQELLIDEARGAAARLLRTSGDPELVRVYRWPDATPQLEVGHLDLMERIEQRLSARPGLSISAAGFRGSGLSDCVADARAQAVRIAQTAGASISCNVA